MPSLLQHLKRPSVAAIFPLLFLIGIVGFGMWYQSGTPSRTQATLQSTLANSGKAGDAIIKSFNSPNQVVPTKTGSGFEIQDNLDGTSPNNFTINFPTQYADHITTVLPGGKTITIRDTNAKNTKGTLLSDQTNQKTKNNPAYIEYKVDERKTIYYAYQKDKASGEKKLKNWILYRNGTGTESESYQFENARITVEKNGSATVYYQDSSPASLAVMPFSLPRPFFINKDGEKVDLDWKLNEKNDTLSVNFSVPTDKYPIVLDPTVVFSPSVTNAAWQATPTSNTSTTMGDYQTTSFTTGNYTSAGTDDTDYATTTASYPTYVEDVFSAYTYTGTGAALTINNGINLASKGGMVWIKERSPIGYDHYLFDTVRGTSTPSWLATDLTNGNNTATDSLNSFNSNGFTLGTNAGVNHSTSTIVSWSFAQAPRFFKVAQVTVSGSNQTVDLSSLGTVGMVMVKRTDSTSAWYTWHRSATAGKLVYLNTTAAETTDGSITVSGTTLTLVQSVIGNGTFIVYAYAHDTSATGIIQCGSFTTNGSGQLAAPIALGWEAQYVEYKAISGTSNWFVYDSMRNMNASSLSGSGGLELYPNLSNAEATNANVWLGPTNSINFSAAVSTTYIYCAIRRGPMKQPTVGTQVYNAQTISGTGVARALTGVGFPPDLAWDGVRTGDNTYMTDRLRGAGQYLGTDTTAAESSRPDLVTSFDMDGIHLGADTLSGATNYSGRTYIYWFLRRYPGVFDEVAYTGTGSNANITHNLGVTPELIIVKSRSNTTNWPIHHAGLTGTTYGAYLNLTNAQQADTTIWPNTPATATTFTVGTVNDINTSSATYVAYLFATKAGISKVGSYTGNGSSQTLNAGFTGGAKFVMIKRTDSTSDWFVWDTTRGIPAGNDPHLSLNTTAVEVATTDDVDADNSGFIVNQNTTTNINVNAATYIYLAFSGDTIANPDSKYATNLYTFDTTGSSNITKLHIDLTAYATASAGNGIITKIWNNNSSAWETLSSLGNTVSSMPGSSSNQEITSSIANYLDGSNKVKLLVSSINPSVSGTDAVLYADYAKLSATTPPTVSSINPTTTPNTNQVVSGIALMGQNFEAGATVTFKKTGQTDIPCTSVSVPSLTALTCDANFYGAVVGTWDIVVTNTDAGTGTLSNGLTITNWPIVSTINPTTTSNINKIASSIALTGQNFVAGATVTFSKTGQTDIPCTGVNVSSTTALTCSANFLGAVVGTWDIVVTNADAGTGTLSNGFTISTVGPVNFVMSGTRTLGNAVVPVVTGTAQARQTLSCSTGTWYGAPTITYTYQWQHTTTNIGSATSSTYIIDAAYVGETIRCVVTATNSTGIASANSNNSGTVVAGVPGTPTIGTATQTGATTATVSFTAPASNGGATITTYTAYPSSGGGGGTLSQSGSGTIYVTGLTAGTSYTFTVKATNSVGQSAASSASNSITPNWAACGDTIAFTYNGGSVTYGTVVGPDSKCWMDRNLGATQVAVSSTDYLAYGSLFQWGRSADGHQLITWTSPTAGTAVNGTTATLADVPGNNLFITINASPNDWRVTPSNTLWANSSSTNNPCPASWHVPTQTEWTAWVTAAGVTNAATAYSSTLKLTLAGLRSHIDGSLSSQTGWGLYWSSSWSGSSPVELYFDSGGVGPAYTNICANAFSVRCVHD